MKSASKPHERGGKLPMNTGPAPCPPRRIGGFKAQSASEGQGRGGTAGRGTASPKISKTTGMGIAGDLRGSSPTGSSTKGQKKPSGPKFGRGPGGLGQSGRGAPWG